MAARGTDRGLPDAAEGVQALIDRLRDEGAARGRHEAEQLLAEARAEAERIRADASAEAERCVAEAHAEAQRTRTATEEALKLAVRDTVLDMRNQMAKRFTAHVEELVTHTTADRALLGEMVLEIVRRAAAGLPAESDATTEIVLPAKAVTLDEIRREGGVARGDEIARLVLGISAEVLGEGLTLTTGDQTGGIRVRRRDDEIEMDLTDAEIARALSAHLLPRYRALLEGLVESE